MAALVELPPISRDVTLDQFGKRAPLDTKAHGAQDLIEVPAGGYQSSLGGIKGPSRKPPAPRCRGLPSNQDRAACSLAPHQDSHRREPRWALTLSRPVDWRPSQSLAPLAMHSSSVRRHHAYLPSPRPTLERTNDVGLENLGRSTMHFMYCANELHSRYLPFHGAPGSRATNSRRTRSRASPGS